MIKRNMLYSTLILFLLLVGCASETSDADGLNSAVENNETRESNLEEKADEPKFETKSEQPVVDKSTDVSSENEENEESSITEGKALSAYSSAEIEYARVWLALGPNQEIDQLNVVHIPAGEPINPDDETSLSYPEDVIQLSGSRLVDGSIVYSGNGDGTVNVYRVPLRWDGEYPAGEEFYQEIIDTTELEYIDPGNDVEVLELIDLLNIQS
mgnify:FL=1